MLKKIFYVLLAALVIIQFIRPKQNVSAGPFPNHITTKFAMSYDVANVFKKSCYDCHSNNTVYPWYANIQPVAWWLQHHVNEGKSELNFSEFAAYKIKRQRKKLEQIDELVSEGEMPLKSYTIIHRNTVLSAAQKAAIKKWCNESIALLPPKEPEKQSNDNKPETEN